MNDKRKVLVLDAHSRAGLSIVQSLGEAAVPVILAGEEQAPLACRSRYVSRYLRYPDPMQKKSEFIQWIKSNTGQEIEAVFCVTDRTIYPLMQMRASGWDDPRFLMPDPQGFEAFFNKEKTTALAAQFGFDVPRTAILEKAGDPCPFEPAFIKTPRSKYWKNEKGYSLSPVLAHSAPQIKAAVEDFLKYDKVIVQEYIAGRGCGIEILSNKGQVQMVTGHKRLHEYPLTGGGSTYRMSWEPPQDLVEKIKKLIAHIQWHGVAMFEFKTTGDRTVLIEVNGRFWGSLPLSKAEGLNFPLELLKVHRRENAAAVQKRRGPMYARNFSLDLQWFWANLRADKKDPFLMTEPVARSVLEYFRIFGGHEVWDHASWRDPAPVFFELTHLIATTVKKVVKVIYKKFFYKAQRQESLALVSKGNIKNILVICYGNICRSPLAERVLREELGRGYDITSAGFHPQEGRKTPDNIIVPAGEHGIDLGGHRSKLISKEIVNAADRIIIMDEQNRNDLIKRFPEARSKIIWLGAFCEGTLSIPDPYDLPLSESRQISGRIVKASKALAVQIKTHAQ
jgi:protein-tyrosine-phosphatase/predicted ATP-grasp superfamily ATP-dependent carboligase